MRALTLLLVVALPIAPSIYLYKRLTFLGVFRSKYDSVISYVAPEDHFILPEIIQAEDLALHHPSGLIVALGQTEAKQRMGWFPAWANLDSPRDGHESRGALWVIDPTVSVPSLELAVC